MFKKPDWKEVWRVSKEYGNPEPYELVIIGLVILFGLFIWLA
jgi:hypothetical protein|tara:strand:+ start:208 stop:333 length:126 start_codon:yes stop_codon:yes gene_type:complete